MGGDDPEKFLPWRGMHSSPGRSQPLALPNQHSTSNTPSSRSLPWPRPTTFCPAPIPRRNRVAPGSREISHRRLGQFWGAGAVYFSQVPKKRRHRFYSSGCRRSAMTAASRSSKTFCTPCARTMCCAGHYTGRDRHTRRRSPAPPEGAARISVLEPQFGQVRHPLQ